MSASWLRMDLSPLAGRDFRLLFGSSTVSLLGTEATNVALVVQVKQLTGSARCPPRNHQPQNRGRTRPRVACAARWPGCATPGAAPS